MVFSNSKAVGPAIGLDLGTTYSCVAIWRRDRGEVIAIDQGNRLTPSCVAFTDEERFVGEAAVNQALLNPANTVSGENYTRAVCLLNTVTSSLTYMLAMLFSCTPYQVFLIACKEFLNFF
jgi:hypothetical protein